MGIYIQLLRDLLQARRRAESLVAVTRLRSASKPSDERNRERYRDAKRKCVAARLDVDEFLEKIEEMDSPLRDTHGDDDDNDH